MSYMKSVWYKKGLNEYLSSKGFKHFLTGESVHEDFQIGRAIMINLKDKTFGIKDMVSSDKLEEASSFACEFEISGALDVVERVTHD